MIDNMATNAAYLASSDCGPWRLSDFTRRFAQYRRDWLSVTEAATQLQRSSDFTTTLMPKPLCIDMEIAATCALACPQCFRQHIATADAIMPESIWRSVINQAAQYQIPSMKLSWRGDPLHHPQLAEIIAHAKQSQIIDLGLNTNGVTLKSRNSHAIIEAGLDFISFSVDGATKQTYEKYRPGRFAQNDFDNVIENIRAFKRLRDQSTHKRPYIVLRATLFEDIRLELKAFKELASEIADEYHLVSYTERGGKLEDSCKWVKPDGTVLRPIGRLPCEFPFRRLFISYDGRASACAYDWGLQYPLGFVSDYSFHNPYEDQRKVLQAVRENKVGFAALQKVKIPLIDPILSCHA